MASWNEGTARAYISAGTVTVSISPPQHLVQRRRSTTLHFTMKIIIAFALLAFAAARPQQSSDEFAAVLREDVVHPDEAGRYSVDFETSNGIVRSESGVGSANNGAVEKQGTIAFTHPNGEQFELKFVASANGGYQPESAALPVAPAFPHAIPDFVLEQIRFAQEEDRNRELSQARGDYIGY